MMMDKKDKYFKPTICYLSLFYRGMKEVPVIRTMSVPKETFAASSKTGEGAQVWSQDPAAPERVDRNISE